MSNPTLASMCPVRILIAAGFVQAVSGAPLSMPDPLAMGFWAFREAGSDYKWVAEARCGVAAGIGIGEVACGRHAWLAWR